MINENTQTENNTDIPFFESGLPFDAVKYKGVKIKIESAVIDKEAINFYNGPADTLGRPTYNKDSKETMWKLVVITEPFPELDDNGNATDKLLVVGKNEDETSKYYRAERKFNFTKKDGIWGISKAPQAKLYRFLRKQGVKSINELKGTIVMLNAEPDRDENSDVMWPRISD